MTDAVWKTIDSALRAQRRSWAWMAKQLNVSDQTANNWSRRKVPANRYSDAAKALGCSVEDLLAGSIDAKAQAAAEPSKRIGLGAAATQLAASVADLHPARRKIISNIVAGLIESGPNAELEQSIDQLAPESRVQVQAPPSADPDAWRRAAFELAASSPDEDTRAALHAFLTAVDVATAKKPADARKNITQTHGATR